MVNNTGFKCKLSKKLYLVRRNKLKVIRLYTWLIKVIPIYIVHSNSFYNQNNTWITSEKKIARLF